MAGDCLGFGDAEAAMRERQRTEEEVERLAGQFEGELHRKFGSLLTDQRVSPGSRSKAKWRPGPRSCGSSPLKAVTKTEDLPEQDAALDEEERPHGVGNDNHSDTSIDGDSESSSPDGTWPAFESDSEEGGVMGSWTKELSDSLSGLEKEQMLPNW